MAHGSELLRVIRGSNVEYDKFWNVVDSRDFIQPLSGDLSRTGKEGLPEMHVKKFWENPRRCGFGARGARREKSRTRLRSPLRTPLSHQRHGTYKSSRLTSASKLSTLRNVEFIHAGNWRR